MPNDSILFHSSYYDQHFHPDTVEQAIGYYADFCHERQLPFEIGNDEVHAMEMLSLEREGGEDAMLNTVMYHAIEVMGMENPNDDEDNLAEEE